MKSAPAEKESTSMTRVNVPDREWHFQQVGTIETHVVYYTQLMKIFRHFCINSCRSTGHLK